ncbi:MAG: thiamine pyrophosphate-dependent enzyme, partial [Anaerolineae bacterium]|nr:thiamine pyrophosphate-dependent enzyme [Anaerolineae bacterium]
LTARTIDNIEEQELVPAGKIAYQFSSKGHELSQVLLGMAMDHSHDGATVYYRSRPFMLACGLTPREAFAADMAKSGSPSEGRDVGVVYSMPPRRGATVLPSSGDVGAQFTPAVGWAQAIPYYDEVLKEKEWRGAIAAALGGDGSVATNGFWAALTIATTLDLPMLFFIEDNGYGISVPSDFQTPGGNIAANLASYGNLNILSGSGTNPEETAALIQQAVSSIRNQQGPCLLRLDVPRLTGHTYGEDQSAYKSQDQMEEERSRDPLDAIKKYLGDKVDWDALAAEVEAEVRRGLSEAEENANPDPVEASQHLFFSGVAPMVPPAGKEPLAGLPATQVEEHGARINFSEAVRKVMEHELAVNPKLMVFGEDVGVRGGVHRVTVGMQGKFGERRVFDTSLSEEGIIGRAVGLALAGLRPLPEIQFRKYADPATEQINDAGWIRWRTAGKFAAPIVVRIPVGHSKRTGDPWHSVSGESIYAHTLGWRIAYPSNAADAAGLLRTSLREQDPTFFLEHRALLDTPPGRRPYPGHDYAIPFGKASIVQAGKDLTIVTWGEMVHRCLEAAQPLGDAIEIIDLRTIIPWDKDAVLRSVGKTGKCLIAHEDTRTAGFGGEIAAVIAEEAFTDLDAPVQRITTIDSPIPYNIPMMEKVIPSVQSIRDALKGLLAW